MYFADTCPKIGVEPTDGLLIILAILCNDRYSDWGLILESVPQGSALGLLLFLVRMSVRYLNKCGMAACSGLLMMHT